MKGYWVMLILLIAGCKEKSPEKKFLDYINDPENKIVQKIAIGEVQITTKWIPGDYWKITDSTYKSEEKGFRYFNVKIEKTKGEKPAKEKILYLDFDMQKDFVLLAGTDSIAPAICQKIENGIAGSYEYMLAFENKDGQEIDGDCTVIYNDKIFGTGTTAFVYDQTDLKKIPTLKYTKTK
jgi:hypothetical protein